MTADPMASTSSASGAVARDKAPHPAPGSGNAFVQATLNRTASELPATASPETQEPAGLIVGPSPPAFLTRGLAIIQYRAENLRIIPVFGPAALELGPRLHAVRIDLADPTHRVIDSQKLHLQTPPQAAAQ